MSFDTSLITQRLQAKGYVSLRALVAALSQDHTVMEITSSLAEKGVRSLLLAFDDLEKWGILQPRFATLTEETLYRATKCLIENNTPLLEFQSDLIDTFIETKWWILGTALPLLESGNIPVSSFERTAYDQLI